MVRNAAILLGGASDRVVALPRIRSAGPRIRLAAQIAAMRSGKQKAGARS